MRPLTAIAGAAVVAGAAAYLLLGRSAQGATTYGADGVPGGIYPLRLRNAPFPSQPGPSAMLVVPPGFRPDAPLRVCVYFRGWSNCVATVVGDRDAACTPGGVTHRSFQLAEQLAASGTQTLLIAPELRVEARSSDPGETARPGGLIAMLDEVLREHLPTAIGPRQVSDMVSLGLMAHSGGGQSLAAAVRQAPPALRSVALLDALYGDVRTFADWLAPVDPARRFACIYTDGGGTAANAIALSSRTAGDVLRDTTSGTLTPEQFRAYPTIFKRSALSHDGVAQYYPQRLWSAGW